MCDYSLCGIPNRLAVEHEELVVHRFHGSTIGLASLPDIHQIEAGWRRLGFWSRMRAVLTMTSHDAIAVCVPPGASLMLKGIPKDLRRKFGVPSVEKVQFIQTSAAENTHRDAVQFCNGRCISLQKLRPGMRVEVLSLDGVDLSMRLGEEVIDGLDDTSGQCAHTCIALTHGFS